MPRTITKRRWIKPRITELLPCPFCGLDDELEQRMICCTKTPHAINCVSCGVMTWGHKTKEEAIKAWNTRATPTNPKGDRLCLEQ